MVIWQVIEFTLAVSIVALMLLIMKWLFHDKLDARWHYLIWLVLAVRMLVPLGMEWLKAPVSLFQAIPLAHWMKVLEYEVSERGIGFLADRLVVLYLAGVVCLSVYYIVIWIFFRLQVAKLPKAPGEIQEQVDRIAGMYGVTSCARIRLGKQNTYCICGYFRPVLLLPQGVETLSEEVILHELLHKKHGDVLVNYVLHLVRIVNWFNPLIWYVTAVIQNDSEALCDQRVLEAMGKRLHRDNSESGKENYQTSYGMLLLAMAERRTAGRRKIGTSDMANSGRSMRIRIKRIADFGKVPAGIGFVALCITVMLSISSIAYYSERVPLVVAGINNERELSSAIRRARLYQAENAEEAVLLYLQAMKEMNPMYLLAVTPEEAVEDLEDWIRIGYAEEYFYYESKGKLFQENWVSYLHTPANPYFTVNGQKISYLQIYNLLPEVTEKNTVVADLVLDGEEKQYLQWELEVFYEKDKGGWKVRRLSETIKEESFQDIPVLFGTKVEKGDWLVEAEARNEHHFNVNTSYATTWKRNPFTQKYDQVERSAEELSSLLTPYQNEMYYLTYQGEDDLTGKEIAVMVQTYDEEELLKEPELAAKMRPELVDALRDVEEKMAEAAAASGNEVYVQGEIESTMYSSSGGYGYQTFDGKELMKGVRKLIKGSGSGYYSWSGSEELHFTVWIFCEGECMEVIQQ